MVRGSSQIAGGRWSVSAQYLGAALALSGLEPSGQLLSLALRKNDWAFDAARKRSLRELGLLVGGRLRGEGFRLGPDLGVTLAMSISNVWIRAALVDANGELIAPFERRLPQRINVADRAALVATVRTAAIAVLEAGLADSSVQARAMRAPDGTPVLKLLGVNVAWPWTLTRLGTPTGFGRRDPSMDEADLVELVREALVGVLRRRHVHANNNVNCTAVSLAFDKARFRDEDEVLASLKEPEPAWLGSLMAVRVSEGIGAGTVECAGRRPDHSAFIDARLVTGAHGLAGDLGHVPIHPAVIRDIWGTRPAVLRTCSCGRVLRAQTHPHLEQVIGAAAIRKRANLPEEAGLSSMLQRTEGAPVVLATDLDHCYAALASGLKGAVAMLDPRWLVLTGPLVSERAVRALEMAAEFWTHLQDPLRTAITGPDGAWEVVRGAGLLVNRRSIYRSFLVDATYTRTGGAHPIWFSAQSLRTLVEVDSDDDAPRPIPFRRN